MLWGNVELRDEIAPGIRATWKKWFSTTGALCNACYSHFAFYGSEDWQTIKDNERCFVVMEIKLLRWSNCVTRYSHVRNGDTLYIWGCTHHGSKAKHLRFYGHMIRDVENSLAMIGLSIEVDGIRPKGRCLDTLDVVASRFPPNLYHNRGNSVHHYRTDQRLRTIIQAAKPNRPYTINIFFKCI